MGEYEGIQSAHEIVCFIDKNSELGGELLNHFGGDLEDVKKAIEEDYMGCQSSLADYAEELTDETVVVPAYLIYYIDVTTHLVIPIKIGI